MAAQTAFDTYESALDALILDITTTAPGQTKAKEVLDTIKQLSNYLENYPLKEIIALEE